MRELLRTKGYKMTPQRELIFRAFLEAGEHVSVEDLYQRVREIDSSIGYSTVWRSLKLICTVGLAKEVNLGDGVTRYERITLQPHGHLYCLQCKTLTEFEMANIVSLLEPIARTYRFQVEGLKCEIHGLCEECRKRNQNTDSTGLTH
ncbi:MAG: transcriptional repressor [Candidatus Zixiibacteriota bacterium]|nr:MAG: transcriptional repressor [candidate division Zixibacteria bacterium]